LARIVCEIRTDLPEIGKSMIMGRLRSMGLHIPKQRVRESIRITDPLNVALRWHGVTYHQPYSVPGPNSLWHIGSHLISYMHAISGVARPRPTRACALPSTSLALPSPAQKESRDSR